MMNWFLKGLLSVLIFINFVLNLGLEIYQVHNNFLSIPKAQATLELGFGNTNDGKGGKGDTGQGTGVCFLNNTQFETTTCCTDAQSCSAAFPGIPGTRSCRGGYVCENSTSSEPYIVTNKSVDKTSANIGETITYTIEVANIGSGNTNNITFNDDFPTGFVATWANTGILSSSNLNHVFSLSAHESLTFIITGSFISANTRSNSGSVVGIITGENCSIVGGRSLCVSNVVNTVVMPPITGECGIPTNSLLYNFTGNGSSLSGTSNVLCNSGSVINFAYNNHQWTWNCSGQNGASNSAQCNAIENYCGDGTTGNSSGTEQCDGQTGCTSICTWKSLSCDDLAFTLEPTQIFINETGSANRNTNDRYNVTTINRGDGSPSTLAGSPVAYHQYTNPGVYTGTLTFTHKHISQTLTCNDTISVINTGTLRILKTIDDNNVEEGELVTYTITINNGTLSTQTGEIQDILPLSFRILSPSITPFPMDFSLDAGESMSYSFSGYFATTGVWTNTGSISGNTNGCNMIGSLCTSSVATNVYSSGLVISKTGFIYSGGVTNKSGRVGQLVKFFVTLVNTSIHSIKDIVVHDIMTIGFFGDVIESLGTTWDAATKNRYIPSLSSNQSVTLTFSGYFTGAGFKTNTGVIVDGYKQYNGGFGTSSNYITVGTASDTIRQTGCKATFNPSNMMNIWTGIAQVSEDLFMVYVMNVGANPGMITSYATSSIVGLQYNEFINSGENGLFKITNRSYANLGDEVNYAIIYINNTNTTQNNLMGMETLFPGYYPIQTQGIFDPVGGERTIGTVTPQGYKTLFFQGYYELPGAKNNIVTANGLSSHATNQIGGICVATDGSNAGGGGGGSDPSEPTLPELQIWKSTDILHFTNTPQSINYYLLIGNSGASILDGSITVTDYLPTSFTGISSVYYTDSIGNTGTMYYQYLTSSNQILITGLSLAYEQTGLITISGTLSGAYTSGQKIVNSGTIYYYSGGVITGSELTPRLYTNNISYATSTYIMSTIATGWATGLSVNKTVSPITGSIGQTFVYTITLTNTGIYTINNVIVSDPLSQLILNGFTGILATTSTGSFDNTNGLRSISQITPNESYTLTLSGYFTFSGVKPNTAALSGCQGTFGCNATATGYIFDTGAIITKTADVSTGCIGQIITYTITVSNKGVQNIQNLNIIDILPSGFVLTSTGSSGLNTVGSNSVGNRTITNFGTTNQVFTVQGFFNTTGIQVNTGIISGCNDIITTHCISTATVTISNDPLLCPLSGVSVSKSISQAIASVGQAIAYLITIQNLNQFSVYDLFIQEQLPTGFTGITATPSTGTYNTATNIRYIPGIGSGSSATLLLSGYFSSTGNKVNTVVLSSCTGTNCTGIATGVITDQAITGQCGSASGFIAAYGTAVNGTNDWYCSGGIASGFISSTGATSRFCEGTSGANSPICTFYTPSCGDGILQAGNEACDTAIPLTTGQTSCNNSCKTLYVCANTGQTYGGFSIPDPNTPSTVYNGCCNNLVGVPNEDPSFLPDTNYSCIDPRPDLALTKTLVSTQTGFISGDIVEYAITIINQGNAPTSDIQIIDYLPNGLTLYTGLTFTRSTPNYTSGRTLSGSNAVLTGRYRLNPGESLQIPLLLIVNANATGIISNAAELLYSSGDVDSAADNNPVNDCYSGNNNISGNALSVGTCSPSTDEDDYDREDISIINAGPGMCGTYNGKTVTLLMQYMPGLCSLGTVFGFTGISNTSGEIIYTWQCSNGGNLSNICSARKPATESCNANNGCPEYFDLSINKVAISTGPYTTGSIATYRIYFEHTGNVVVNDAKINDYLPLGQSLTGVISYSNPSIVSGTNISGNIITRDLNRLEYTTGRIQYSVLLSNGISASSINMVDIHVSGANASLETIPYLTGICVPGNNPISGSLAVSGTNNVDCEEILVEGVVPTCSTGYVFNSNTNQCVPYILSINKQGPSQTTYIINQDILYLIQVTNHGPQAASGVTVQDYLPNGFALNYAVMNSLYGGNPVQPTINGSTISWNIPTIASGQVITLFVYGKFTEAHGVGTGINTGAITSGYCVNCTGVDIKHVDICGPEGYLLSINKTGNRTTGLVYDIWNYTISINSIGYATATNLLVNELFPADFIITNYSVSNGTFATGGGSGLWTITSLSPNSSRFLNITGYYTTSGIKVNTAILTNTCATCNPNPNTSWTGVVGAYPYLLSINKSSTTGSLIAIGQPIMYALDVHNYGPQTATGIIITDILPAGFVLVPNAVIDAQNVINGASYGYTGYSYNPSTRTISWNIANIPSGSAPRLLIYGYPTVQGILLNTATILSGLCLGTGCYDSDIKNVDICGPEGYLLSINKSSSRGDNASGMVQSPISYTITVTNTGYKTANNITINDIMPTGFSGTASTSTGSFTLIGGTRNLNLEVGQSATLTLSGYYTTSGVKTNTATITSGVCLPGSCSSSVTNTINDVPYNLIINKSVTNSNVLVTTGTALINDNLTYTITVTNQGPQTASGIIISDLMPSGFVLNGFIPYQVSTGTFNVSTMIWSNITLESNQSATLQLLGQYTTDGIKTNYAVIMSGLAFNATGIASIDVLPCTNGMTCVHTGVCNTGYHAQVYTGTPTIDTGLLCIGGTTTGLIKTTTGWTWNCLGMGGGGNTNGCYLTINTGTTNTGINCGSTGQVICSTGNPCMTGLVNEGGVCVNSCSSGYNLSGVHCIACGNSGQVVCNSGSGCITGLVNSGGICIMTGAHNTGVNNTGTAHLSGLRINKTVSRLYALPGETVTWTINYGIYGTGVYEGVIVEDILPAGGEFISTSLSTGYSYTGGVLSYTAGTLTGVYTGSFTVVMKIGTGVSTGIQLVNTVSGSASGWNTIIGTAVVNVGLAPVAYVPVNLGGGGAYIPVPLPEAPVYNNPPTIVTTVPEVITYVVRKTRMLAIQAEEDLPAYLAQANEQLGEYIPYYTQPLEAIKKNVEVMPHTGVITLYEIIMKILREIV